MAGGRLVSSAGENFVALRTCALNPWEEDVNASSRDYHGRVSQNLPAEFIYELKRRKPDRKGGKSNKAKGKGEDALRAQNSSPLLPFYFCLRAAQRAAAGDNAGRRQII